MISVNRLNEFLREANSLIQQGHFQRSRRKVIAASHLTVTLDHGAAISILIESQQYNSAAALLRIMYEALICGLWIQRCATDEEITFFVENDFLKNVDDNKRYVFQDLVSVVTNELSYGNMFEYIKREFWNPFCSFTHSGIYLVDKNVGTDFIGMTYDEAEIDEILNFALYFSAPAFIELSNIADLTEKADSIVNKYFSGNTSEDVKHNV